MASYRKTSRIDAPAPTVFAWHERPGAFERLVPPWDSTRVISRSGGLAVGGRVELETSVGPVKRRWLAEHTDLRPGESFRDRQVAGPFAAWEHEHGFIAQPPGSSLLEDVIEYALPGGRLGAVAGARTARQRIERVFAYRHRITAMDIATHQRYASKGPKTIAITGASGMQGQVLVPFLAAGGHTVIQLTRKGDGRGPRWDPEDGTIDAGALEGVDAVIHLAGESIGEGRWTSGKKERIMESRRKGTRLIADTVAGLQRKPSVFVSASAIGVYGNRGDEVLTELSTPGDDFLAGVVKEWEASTAAASAAGIRTVNLRFGVILTPKGGALKRLLLPFKLGAGGRVGSGKQWWSWVGIDDVISATLHAVMTDSLSGPVNVVAPNPVTNGEFVKALGRVLHRPAILPTPVLPLKLVLGEVVDALLLVSQRVQPTKLLETGYEFHHAELEPALRHVLGK